MALNPSIILSGQQPNVLQSLNQGAQAATAVNNSKYQTNYRNALAQHGAGALQGEQGAMSALAAYDPQAMQGLQAGRLNMDAKRQSMEVLSAQEKRAIETHAANMSAAERQQEIAAIDRGMETATALYLQGDLQGLNMMLAGVGEQPVDSLDQFEPIAMKYKTTRDMLEAYQDLNPAPEYGFDGGQFYNKNDPAAGAQPIPGFVPEEKGPLSAIGKLKDDYDLGRITREEYEIGLQKLKPTGMTLEVGPDGGVSMAQGPGVTGNGIGNKTGDNQATIRELDSRDTLARLNRIEENIAANPDVLDAQSLSGQMRRMGLEWKDFISGGDLTPEQAEFLVAVTQQRGDVLENLNYTIKAITGAAMTESEAVRIGATLPGVNDGPTVFKAKLERALSSVRMSVARYNYWRNNGLEGDPQDVGTLSDMTQIMKDRGKEIYNEELAAGDPATARDRAKARLSEEFGL